MPVGSRVETYTRSPIVRSPAPTPTLYLLTFVYLLTPATLGGVLFFMLLFNALLALAELTVCLLHARILCRFDFDIS